MPILIDDHFSEGCDNWHYAEWKDAAGYKSWGSLPCRAQAKRNWWVRRTPYGDHENERGVRLTITFLRPPGADDLPMMLRVRCYDNTLPMAERQLSDAINQPILAPLPGQWHTLTMTGEVPGATNAMDIRLQAGGQGSNVIYELDHVKLETCPSPPAPAAISTLPPYEPIAAAFVPHPDYRFHPVFDFDPACSGPSFLAMCKVLADHGINAIAVHSQPVDGDIGRERNRHWPLAMREIISLAHEAGALEPGRPFQYFGAHHVVEREGTANLRAIDTAVRDMGFTPEFALVDEAANNVELQERAKRVYKELTTTKLLCTITDNSTYAGWHFTPQLEGHLDSVLYRYPTLDIIDWHQNEFLCAPMAYNLCGLKDLLRPRLVYGLWMFVAGLRGHYQWTLHPGLWAGRNPHEEIAAGECVRLFALPDEDGPGWHASPMLKAVKNGIDDWRVAKALQNAGLPLNIPSHIPIRPDAGCLDEACPRRGAEMYELQELHSLYSLDTWREDALRRLGEGT